MTSPSNTVPIAPPPAHRRREALGLVFGDAPAEERDELVEGMLGEGEGNEAVGLFGAWAGEEMAGAVMGQVQPGRTAAVWLPRLTPKATPETAHALMTAVCRWLKEQDVVLAQVLAAELSASDRMMLEAARFVHLAELLYLVAVNEPFPPQPPATMLRFVPAAAVEEDRLATVVDRTYESTRDCEALDGVRRTADVLAGYRAVGSSGSSEWFLVRCDNDDAGCLILADHPRQGNLELVYMGVVPSCRGRGWGVDIARWAQWRAGVLGRERLVLAVDAENGPALTAYAAAGFRAWDQRSVYIRTFDSR